MTTVILDEENQRRASIALIVFVQGPETEFVDRQTRKRNTHGKN